MPPPIGRQIQLPLSKAMGIAWRSLRVRVGRSVLTLATIAMAIAFLTDVAGVRVLMPARPGAVAATEGAAPMARTVWLLSLSLLVCAVGISNAMLMSVMERFREIGTMKCLGALDAFILRLFFFESLFLGVGGSVIGVAIGLGLAVVQVWVKGGHAAAGWPMAGVAAGGIVVGTVITAAAAAYPSYKAARMHPIEAMRVEV